MGWHSLQATLKFWLITWLCCQTWELMHMVSQARLLHAWSMDILSMLEGVVWSRQDVDALNVLDQSPSGLGRPPHFTYC